MSKRPRVATTPTPRPAPNYTCPGCRRPILPGESYLRCEITEGPTTGHILLVHPGCVEPATPN